MKKIVTLIGLAIMAFFLYQGIMYCWKEYNYNWKFSGQLDSFTGEDLPFEFDGKQLSVSTNNALGIQIIDDNATVADSVSLRNVQSLNGNWRVEEGDWDIQPTTFNHSVQVPGLLDLAEPNFEFPLIDPSIYAIGPKKEFASPRRTQVPIITDDKRDAFWYKKTFTHQGAISEVVILKIYKAKYHTAVWLNGEKIGENPHNFAPGYFNITKALKTNGEQNELVIRIGASMSGYQGKGTHMDGFDIEKTRYYPGIYDNVELISSGASKINNIQVSPVPKDDKLRVAVWLQNHSTSDSNEKLEISISDYKNPDSILQVVKTEGIKVASNGKKQVYFELPFKNAKLWSPNNPNLYNITVKSSNDEFTTRFGMREFHFDEITKKPILNGKITYLRGSNLSFFRFTEDPNRGTKAWDEAWVRRIFKKAKDMHWNVLRTSLGPPPEFWYRIADEEGVMIVDEAPVWTLFRELNLRADTLVYEYTAQLQEHWNYPSIIMWDAQNETPFNPQTLMALKVVRGIDLSNRAWDNGWGVPDKANDPFEEHVYPHFASMNLGQDPLFDMNNLKELNYKVDLGFHNDVKDNPLIINEYGWLWLQRNGEPTKLTEKGYAFHLPNSTADERFEFWNYRLASLTESMRARRVEGVMNFTLLTHSYPGCYTSDNFTDLVTLNFEPHFEKYMKPAFSPLGLCIWNWDEKFKAGISKTIPVKVYNDSESAWTGTVKLLLEKNGISQDLAVQSVSNLDLGEVTTLDFNIKLPSEKGNYKLVSQVTNNAGELINSVRKISID
tara:strand:- start:22925 stop:25267 length:2343 start_codon:yes stop_codon:yes gene_type:complete